MVIGKEIIKDQAYSMQYLRSRTVIIVYELEGCWSVLSELNKVYGVFLKFYIP